MSITSKSFIRSTALLLLVGFIALLGIVGTNIWLVERSQGYFEEINAGRLARRVAVDLRARLLDMQTGQRGFLLTQDETYLEPFHEAEPFVNERIAELREVLAPYPQANEPLNQLEADIAFKIDEMNRTIAEMRAGNRDAAIALVKTDAGEAAMGRIREMLGALVQAVDRRLGEGSDNQRNTIGALRWVSVIGGVVILTVISAAIWAVLSYTRALLGAQREVEAANASLEERVRERTSDLGKANEEIQRFAYVVTHDLRAPLVNIMGFTSELETSIGTLRDYMASRPEEDDPQFAEAKQAATEDLPEAISFIRAGTRKMDALINAILKISREGRRQLKPEPVDIGEVARNTVAAVQHQITEFEGSVNLDIRLGTFVTDRLSIEQVLGNLLDNAVKYHEPSRPLKVTIRAMHVPGNRVHVEVEDNGRGIADTDHERVFELFRRSGAQTKPGEGIGLAHVRTMVRALGGDVTLKSTLGEGTTFIVNLPRDLRSHLGKTGHE